MTGAPPKCSLKRSGSMVAEVMITLRSGRRGSSRLQVAEDEVDVQAALVRLVDDQRVVAEQLPVVLQLGQQDAVGHQLDQRAVAGRVGEADLVADRARRAGCPARRRCARRRCGRRAGGAGCGRSGP